MPNITRSALLLAFLSLLAAPAALAQLTSPQETVLFGEISLSEWGGVQPASSHNAAANAGQSVLFFPSASDPLGRQGFVRVVNQSSRAGTASITAFDDAGRSHGPVRLSLDGLETVHLNSGDLEDGNSAKGLADGVGSPSQGDWRLELSSDLDVKVLSYIRTSDGFVTAMHDVAPSEASTHRVAFFNPGSNYNQESLLRIVNPGDGEASVTIRGVDDRGAAAPGGAVRLSIPARAARTASAADLEGGASGLRGALGDGTGKWRLAVEADVPVHVMSLLATPTGHLTNLSTDPGDDGAVVDDTPPAPRIEVTGARTFKVHWTHTGRANDTHAFDISVRLGRSGGWTEECRTATYPADGEQKLSLDFRVSSDIPAGTVIQGRWRHRGGSSCSSGSPASWSQIGEATVQGGGSGQAPDLVVESAAVDDSTPDAGASFTFSATVRNRGDAQSASTTLRYYRSSNSTISTSDSEVGTDPVGQLAASANSRESTLLTAPSTAGTYYYGACVDSVSGESSTANNCSDGVRVVVSGDGGGGGGRAGECVEGATYDPGEGCDVYGTGGSSSKERFEVLSDGRGRFGFFTAGNGISNRGGSINGVRYHFVASHQGGGTWIVDEYRP